LILILFQTADVLDEDVILKWYKESHSNKGKTIFLEQMKKFVEWLQDAEEGNLSFDILFYFCLPKKRALFILYFKVDILYNFLKNLKDNDQMI